MQTGTQRTRAYLTAGLLAIAGAAAPPLAAQGAQGRHRPVEPAAAVRVERSHLEPARRLLRTLVGTWRFEIRFAGNLDSAPDASGTRVVSALFDDLRLEWTEELDDSPIRGRGMIGFDPTSDRFFSVSVYNAGAAAEVTTGSLDDAEPLVTFSPVSPSATQGETLMRSAALSMLDQDHFTLAALDRGWRAMFTRQN